MKHRTLPFILAGLLSLLTTAGRADEDGTEPAGNALVQTAPVQISDVAQRLAAYGSVGTSPGEERNLAALRAAEVDTIPVVAGMAVHKGAILMTLKTAPDAYAAYTQARSAADAARAALSQDERLFAGHLITNAQLATSRQAAADADANLKAQEAVGGGELETAVRAPADGVVGAIAVHAGDRVAANTVLLGFTGTNPLYVQLGIAPEEAAAVRSRMAAEVRSVFAPDRQVAGRVSNVGAGIDPASGLVEVLVRLAAGAGAVLAPGTAVNGDIILKRVHGPAVPRSAVLKDDAGSYVFVVRGGFAHRINVTTGPDDGKQVAVTRGIKPGERVVTLGNYELEDGMAVREQPR